MSRVVVALGGNALIRRGEEGRPPSSAEACSEQPVPSPT